MLVVELSIVAFRGPVGPLEPGNKKPPTATGAGEGARRRKARWRLRRRRAGRVL